MRFGGGGHATRINKMWCGTDTANNLEETCFTGDPAWNTSLNRNTGVLLPTLISNFLVNLTPNNNTIDGALFEIKFDDVMGNLNQTAPMQIIVDQATGTFQNNDDAATQLIIPNGAYQAQYQFGDGTVITKQLGVIESV